MSETGAAPLGAMTDIGMVRIVVIDAYPQNGTRAERESNTSALEALDRLSTELERLRRDNEHLKAAYARQRNLCGSLLRNRWLGVSSE